MDYGNLNRKYELLEELDLDLTTEETIEDNHIKLILINETSQPEKNLSQSHIQDNDKENEVVKLSGEDEQELYAEPQSTALSSLAIYFKAISRHPLLDEEEERSLAKRIKESEVECKHLVVKWKHLLKNEFLGMFPIKQMKEILSKLRQANGYFNLFDDLIKLEKERKKVSRVLNRTTDKSIDRKELEEGLHKLEAAIAKCIAKISLSKTTINKLTRNLKRITHGKTYTKKRQVIEKELRSTLREIDKHSKEIKVLKNQLVQSNLRLVISIAKKYDGHGIALSDLIQDGNLGLIRAIDTYDYRRGHRFITYATWWIRQAMIRALDCQSRTIRTPVYINEKLNQIVKASNRLLKKHQREPTLMEIAQETNIPLESIQKVMGSFKDSIPLDTLTEEKGEGIIKPSLDHETISVLEQVISSNLSHTINNLILSDLTQREREIVKLRFGIGEKHDHTLEEIGKEFNLSRERIRQILEGALGKLRSPKSMMKLKDFINPN